MLRYEIVEVWLTTELVYPLRYFIAGSVAKTREKREDFGGYWFGSGVAEDDRRQCRERDLRRKKIVQLGLEI